ncbi:MAG: Hsp20/alpha crystallin family protein [Patescibacteria group bacterium]|jgi:HSP20 family protein
MEANSPENTEDGQLAIDVYQSVENIVLKAPIAGVRPEDLDISITDETIIIKGERHNQNQADAGDYLVQECYWGPFSRTYTLPALVIADKANALLKEGILTITVPKDARSRTKVVTVQAG